MAFRNMTGTTCGGGQILTFVAEDSGVAVNDFFQMDTGVCIQINAINTASTETNNTGFLVKEYASCDACLAPISANTKTTIPVYLNSNLSQGTATASTYNPPAPVWTNSQNHAVLQQNMVTLGGNGLNN